MGTGSADRGREAALLPSAPPVDRVVEVVLVVLVAASATRYLIGHGFGDSAGLVLPGGVALVAGYAARRAVPISRQGLWLAAVCLLWLGLVLVAPSFGWCALALAFAALRVLPYRAALAVIVALVTAVSATWVRMSDRLDPTVVLGPACLAVLAVGAYRALERDAAARQALLDDLRAAQDELAVSQRREGALGERHRLSREIHDSVAQDLSSINLLLQAAEQSWSARPAAAREHVHQAAATARDGLAEARRVVHDLSPAAVQDGSADPVDSLAHVLRQLAGEVSARHGLRVQTEVTGEARPVSGEVATALVRTARGALANVVEHARASTAVVTLSYLGEQVSLDVCDDGQGLSAGTGAVALDGTGVRGVRGLGLRGIRDRVEGLGGQLVLESAPGRGTALAVTLPTTGPA